MKMQKHFLTQDSHVILRYPTFPSSYVTFTTEVIHSTVRWISTDISGCDLVCDSLMVFRFSSRDNLHSPC